MNGIRHSAAHRVRAVALTAVVLAALAAGASPAHAATLVVDRDRVECANAGFTSIQAAVDRAQSGDLISVCPDTYAESVVIDKPLTLKGDPDAIETLDCFQPTQPELSPAQHAIVDPAGDDFSIALQLKANDVAVEGFVIQGASVGVDASDLFSGYRVDHNLIRLNGQFGIDLGSEGTADSRVHHNCIRDNRFGLVSELDDDSSSDRGAGNARDLINARIDHNATLRNTRQTGVGNGLEATGPGQRDRVTFDHNVLQAEVVGIGIQNATHSAIVENEISAPTAIGIFPGGANVGLVIRANTVQGVASTVSGIRVSRTEQVDVFPQPSSELSITENQIHAVNGGVVAFVGSLVDSLIADNTTSDNRANGINLFSGNTRNVIRANQADNNRTAGINVQGGATGNTLERNSMHGNGTDARDLNPLINGMLQNDWIGNDCDTDNVEGRICGVG